MAAEKQFETRLKNWLVSEGIYPLGEEQQKITVPPCGYWEKRWGGGKYIKSGMPDMHIVVNGISIEAELKSETGRPSDLQKQKLNQVDKSGCIAVVVFPHDFENFKRLILSIKSVPNHFPDLVRQAGLENGWNKG